MRKRMVTRTIENTKVNALCLDVETAEPMNKEFNLSGSYKDEKKLLAACQSAYDTDTLKVVHIVDSEIVKTRFGMDEKKFLAEAEELPLLVSEAADEE